MLFKCEIHKTVGVPWKMLIRRMVFTMAVSVFACFPSGSQTVDSYAHASLAEKIYLQLDSKVYTTNQTIWFKSIVVNAINHAPTKLSGVLYAELIAPDEQIVEMKLIKLEEGIGDGFFGLHQSYAEGVYQVRAYTEWNKNFGPDFIFTDYIQIFASSGMAKADPIGKITLDKKTSPEISFSQVSSIVKVDSVADKIVEKNIERKKADDAFKLSAGDILLGEVVVEAYRLTPERKMVNDEYGEPDAVISGKAIQDKEKKWSYGLYSVLMFNFPDNVTIRRSCDGNLYARVNPSEPTLVVIDGFPVQPYEYPYIPNIPPSEVKSLEIIEGAKNFTKLYLKLFPFSMNPPAWGDVIAIYTHGGNGIYGAKQPVGIVKAAVPVFAAPREFYTPKYENIQPEDWYKPDLRALVHWEPKLRADSTGKASASFYNADNLGEMMVVVEAISDKGELGYQEFIYKVKKNEENKER